MDSVTAAKRMRGTVGMLAMHWLMATSTREKAAAEGMPADPLEAYAIGRFGVLGDCPIDNVVGAAFFWEPDYLRSKVVAGRAVMAPGDGAKIYVDICRAWGEDHLLGFEGAGRLGELIEAVVASARPHGAPTFVGWRDQPLPPEGPGRTFQLAQTMRELGFARHCTAVQAAGMSPVQAIMSSPTGAWNARFFGWPEPFPDGERQADARKEIEAASNRMHAPDFEVLDDSERAELVDLAAGARQHADALLTPESMAAVPS